MKKGHGKEIEKLRLEGLGYKKIASELNISINTVKSYCRTNNLTSEFLNKQSVCKECGKPILQKDKTKTIKFCSDVCRRNWWNANRIKLNRKTMQTHTCRFCSKEFKAYSKDKRKYCSHDCYISDRFGEHHG